MVHNLKHLHSLQIDRFANLFATGFFSTRNLFIQYIFYEPNKALP